MFGYLLGAAVWRREGNIEKENQEFTTLLGAAAVRVGI